MLLLRVSCNAKYIDARDTVPVCRPVAIDRRPKEDPDDLSAPSKLRFCVDLLINSIRSFEAEEAATPESP